MRAKSSLLFPLLLLCLSINSQAQLWSNILSPARGTDWTQAGAGTIPTNRTQCGSTIAPYGSSGSPASPSTIANVINACAAGTYVQLGTGTFYLNGTLMITKSNVSLRGNGPQKTIVNFSNASPCGESHPAAICVAGGDDGTDGSAPPNVASMPVAPLQGATSIVLGTQTTGSTKPVVGQILELQQQVDGTSPSADTWQLPFSCFLASGGCSVASSGVDDGSPTEWGGLFQLVVVTSIAGGTCTNLIPCAVGISPSIHMPNWGQNPNRVWWQNESSTTGVGIENLQTAGAAPQIGFRWATYGWIKNVELNGSATNSAPHYILLNKTVGITTRDSLLWGEGNWSDEYAWDCYACSASLVENNIIGYLRTVFTQEQGEFNVLSANYDIDNASSSNQGNEEGIFNNHGCCSSYLYGENNDAVNWVNDDYYGQTFFTTLLRNRIYGSTTLDTPGNTGYLTPIISSALTRYPNFIGNVLGNSASGNPSTSNTYSNYQQVGSDNNNNCSYGNASIYSIGKYENCGGSGSVPNDAHAAPSSMRWGNWDVVTNTVRWCGNSSNTGWSTTCGSTPEVPAGMTDYANPVPASQAIPASFLYTSQPSWWSVTGQTAIPWPPIGPDVTGGNISGSGGFAYKIPARVCYESLGGSFSSSSPPAFDANSCYSNNPPPPPPAAPTGLSASVQP
jgi:hypothetical protein